MTAEPTGKVVTFYSFKGGTGRTMALANVAWILAANGKRVLAVDWDLESPGLHRYFAPFLSQKDIGERPGVIGLIQEFQDAKRRELDGFDEPDVEESTDLAQRIIELSWEFPGDGRLDLLPAGRLNMDYAKNLAGVDWDDFYERQDGARFFGALRDTMKEQYDYTLIDSRTGYSDVADICTIGLPDVLIDCFTLNGQGIDGSATVAQLILKQRPEMRILPVPMRLDPAEKNKADAGRAVAQQRFGGLPTLATEEERTAYWNRMQVPYQAYYAYEEVLATFRDTSQSPGSLLEAYETLTRELTEGDVTRMPPMDGSLRRSVNAQFERRLVVAETDVALRYADRDAVWAEWLGHVLAVSGVRVVDPVADPEADTSGCRDMLILSGSAVANPALELTPLGAPRSALAVHVADVQPVARANTGSSIHIFNLSEQEAVEEVLKLVGRSENGSVPPVTQGSPRFPGDEPVVANLLAPNTRFTGREDELRTLRRQLGSGGAIVLSAANPVTLQGMGGVGKTAIALEYAQRFRSAYDVIWFVSAEPVTFIDAQLHELGRRLGLPIGPVAPENARMVLDALNQGRPHKRWLLIFDNAEDPARVSTFLPSGPGHVLVTSRNPSWANQARTLPVDVFERRESIDHFLSRTPAMTPSEADRLAGLLGDLPIAVASAAAFLAETDFSVADLVHDIEERGPDMIPMPAQAGVERTPSEQAQAQSVQVVWDRSLNRLRERSVAGYRLLQLCSQMDTSVARDIIYGEQMAQALTPYDPSLTERLLRGRMVLEISRLALARVEPRSDRRGRESEGGRISMHRLVQWAVRSRMSPEELGEARHQVHLILARSRPDGEVEDPETWPRFSLLWPHLERSGAVECGDPTVRQLVIERVRYLWVTGDFNRGLERARQTEKVWVERLATMDEEGVAENIRQNLFGQLLHLQFNMANLLRSLGELEKSRALDEHVLAEQQKLLGEDHPLALVTAGSLAADLRALGHYKNALERDKATYAAWQELFGGQHARTLTAMNNLATAYRLVGNYREALRLDMLAHEGREEDLGERHPYTLNSFGHIGRDLREAGEYEKSVQWLREAAAMYEEEFQSEARDTLNANVNLAISLRSAGHLDEANRLFDKAYERLSDKFPIVPDTLNCRLSRSVTLLGLGNEFAASELRAVYDAYRGRLGGKHPHTLVCLNNMAMGMLDDDPQQARDLAREAATDFAAAVGPDHPYTLAAEANLGISLAQCGSTGTALEILRRAAQRSAENLDPEHPDTLCCAANIALVELRTGHGDEKEVEQITERLSVKVGSTHPAVLAVGRHRFVPRVIDPLPF